MSKLPEMSAEIVNQAFKVLIIACINTGAKDMKASIDKFHGPDGEVYGDFEIKVKRK